MYFWHVIWNMLSTVTAVWNRNISWRQYCMKLESCCVNWHFLRVLTLFIVYWYLLCELTLFMVLTLVMWIDSFLLCIDPFYVCWLFVCALTMVLIFESFRYVIWTVYVICNSVYVLGARGSWHLYVYVYMYTYIYSYTYT